MRHENDAASVFSGCRRLCSQHDPSNDGHGGLILVACSRKQARMRQIVEISSAFLGLLVLLGSSDATAAKGESLNFRPEQYDTELVYSWPKTPAISKTSEGKSASQAIESMEGVEEFVPRHPQALAHQSSCLA